ncbi:MAG TPA: metal-dependent hydrolase [Firmicutes bacterium]|nr:metal-dependent hydrolase [Bacillota bacterium]
MKNKIKWLGHAAFEITTAQEKRILIDPWISGNPLAPVNAGELERPDLILITHDHHDHYGSDLPKFLKNGQGILAAQPEVVAKAKEDGISADNIVNGGSGMNIGGTVEIDGIKVTMTQAVHSSDVGTPAGFIITLEDGKVIYHAGDTGIFSAMELFAELYSIDVALLPIGSVFVMDPKQAALALKLLRPKAAIPMHYKTFPILEQNADRFIKFAKEKAPQVEIKVLEPGEHVLV